MTEIAVSSLRVYPLKSAAGVEVAKARVTDRGFAHDRRWMLVDEQGKFITQRSHPELALVKITRGQDTLGFERPGADRLETALHPADGAGTLEVRVWRSECEAIAVDQAADRWFSDFLGRPCRLVYMPDSTRRRVDPDHGDPDDIVSFADGYPFLLVEQASLDDLNRRLDEPVPMDRFRPNIVVTGASAFAADDWSRIEIGGVSFRVAKPCGRCVVTTIDQTSARKGTEPLRTLTRYRRGDDGDVRFGQYLVQQSAGVIRVGDEVVTACG